MIENTGKIRINNAAARVIDNLTKSGINTYITGETIRNLINGKKPRFWIIRADAFRADITYSLSL